MNLEALLENGSELAARIIIGATDAALHRKDGLRLHLEWWKLLLIRELELVTGEHITRRIEKGLPRLKHQRRSIIELTLHACANAVLFDAFAVADAELFAHCF